MATLEEYKRFLANEPESQIEYRTIEIWHPQFSQTYRFVANYEALEATLEIDAPRNAGELVTFEGATMKVTEPAETEANDTILGVEFGNVDGRIHEIIDQISGQGFFQQTQIIYRKYYSADLSEPAITPLYLFASAINFQGFESVGFTAEDTDLTNKSVGTIYTLEDFKGLAN